MALFSKINTTTQFLQNTSWFKNKFLVNFGYVEDGPSSSDLNYSSTTAASKPVSPGDVNLKQYFKEVSNQYTLSSCVANAVADSLEAQIAHRKGVDPSQVKDLSRLFIYYNARNLDTPSCTNVDKGSRIRLAFDSVARYGVPNEETWAYDLTKVYQRPSILAYREAIINKIYKFYRVYETGDNKVTQMKQALFNGNPVVFGLPLADSFKYVNNDSPVTDPGGYSFSHALVAVGWNESNQSFLIRNSWGKEWGNVGYCSIDKNYIANVAKDVWVATF